MEQVSFSTNLDSNINEALMDFCQQTGSIPSNVVNAALKDYLSRFMQRF